MFLTKFDDDIIREHLIGKYANQDVYKSTNTRYEQFVLSVKKFTKEVEI